MPEDLMESAFTLEVVDDDQMVSRVGGLGQTS